MISSKSRIRVCGAEYQQSKIVISQSAYGVSVASGIRPGGRLVHADETAVDVDQRAARFGARHLVAASKDPAIWASEIEVSR